MKHYPTKLERKATHCQPWQVNTMRLLICLAPMALWRKKKALTSSFYYFDGKGVARKNRGGQCSQEEMLPQSQAVSYSCQTLFYEGTSD